MYYIVVAHNYVKVSQYVFRDIIGSLIGDKHVVTRSRVDDIVFYFYLENDDSLDFVLIGKHELKQ